jgi:non-heme chloroperoxidase
MSCPCQKSCKCSKKQCIAPRGVDLATLPVIYRSVVTNSTFPPNGPGALSPTILLNVVQASANTGGRDILFIHGYPHSWASWKNVLGSSLALKNNLYVMDTRGFGQSQNPGPGAAAVGCTGYNTVWNPDTHARDIAAVITTLGLRNPILVGQSLGGTLVADFVRVYGTNGTGGVGGACSTPVVGGPRISGIILSGSFPEVNPAWFTPATLAIVAGGDLFTPNFTKLLPAVDQFATISTYCRPRDPEYAELRQMDMSNTVDSRVGALGTLPTGANNDAVWRSVTVPTWILYGEKDGVINFDAQVKLLSLIPGSQLKLIKCGGHITQYDRPREFNALIAEFLTTLPPLVL